MAYQDLSNIYYASNSPFQACVPKDELVVGMQVLWDTSKRTTMGLYRIVEIRTDGRHGSFEVVLERLTKTGRVKKNADRMVTWDNGVKNLFPATEFAVEQFNEIMEDTIRYTSAGPNRDSQKTKVYRSEQYIRRHNQDAIGHIEYLTDIQAYVDKVIRMEWFTNTFGFVRPQVLPQRTHKNACASYYQQKMWFNATDSGKWSRNEMVILHELAHVVECRGSSHGEFFCATFLELLDNMLPEIGSLLRTEYVERGIKHTHDQGFERRDVGKLEMDEVLEMNQFVAA